MTIQKTLPVVTSLVLLLAGCGRSPEALEAAHLKRGNAYLGQNEFRKAFIEFRVASQNMPKDPEPLYELGMAYLKADAAADPNSLLHAYEAFQKALEIKPGHAASRYRMALFRIGSTKLEEVAQAKEVISKYLAGHPTDAEAMGSLAIGEAKLGNRGEAIRQLEAQLEKEPDNTRPAAVVLGLYTTQGDTGAARDLALQLAAHFPNSPGVITLRANTEMSMHEVEGVDAEIAHALSLKADYAPALDLKFQREIGSGKVTEAEATTKQIATLPEPQHWTVHGRLLFTENKVEAAVAEYNRQLLSHGDNAAIRDELAGLLLGADRTKQAHVILSETITRNPQDALAVLMRLSLEIDGASDGEALKAAAADVQRMHELKAFSAPLSYQEARLAGARQDVVEQGNRLAEALKRNPHFLVARADLAQLLIDEGQPGKAIDVLEAASNDEKTSPVYVYAHNAALMATGNFVQSRNDLDVALAAGKSPRLLYQDAEIRIHDRDLAGARQALETALQIAPAEATVYDLLGNVMRRHGEAPKYFDMLRAAVRKHPDVVALQETLGNQLSAAGDANGARVAFEAARAAGDAVNADCAIAVLDMRAGGWIASEQRLRQLVKMSDSARAELLLAEIDLHQGHTDLVLTDYTKALQLQPTNVSAMNNLADFLATKRKDFENARFWAQKALALQPASPVVEDTLGWIDYQQGRFADALPFLEKSLRGMDRPIAHYHLAAAALQVGDAGRANREYQIALKQDPKSPARPSLARLFEAQN